MLIVRPFENVIETLKTASKHIQGKGINNVINPTPEGRRNDRDNVRKHIGDLSYQLHSAKHVFLRDERQIISKTESQK